MWLTKTEVPIKEGAANNQLKHERYHPTLDGAIAIGVNYEVNRVSRLTVK